MNHVGSQAKMGNGITVTLRVRSCTIRIDSPIPIFPVRSCPAAIESGSTPSAAGFKQEIRTN